MTRHLDPDRRRPAPSHPGFDPREIDVDMDICRWCGAHIPAAEAQRIKHEDWEQRIANRFAQLIERVAILEAAIAQVSGSGSRTATSTGATADASPDPAPKSPPTPVEKASDEAGPAGAEGSNQSTEADAAAGTSLGDVTPPPAVFPPAAGGTQRAGRGSGGTGDVSVSAPAGTTGRLHLVDGYGRAEVIDYNPPDHGKWTR